MTDEVSIIDSMEEALLVCTALTFTPVTDARVRWLDQDGDYDLAHEFWRAGGFSLKRDEWDEIHNEGYRYSGLVEDQVLASRAAVWTYSSMRWELAAVSTRDGNWARGYATAVCSFVTAHILASGRTATCHTRSGNGPMQRVVLSLGYCPSTEAN